MAKTTNEIIFDKLVKHQVYLLRLVTGQTEDFISALNKNNPKLAAFLIDKLPGLNLADTKTSAMKWRKFEQALRSVRGEAFDQFRNSYDKDLLKMIDNETKYMKALYDNSIAIAEVTTVVPAIKSANLLNYGFIDGKTVSTYFQELQYGDVDRIIQSVRTGLLESKPAYQIVNDLIGDKNIQYANGTTNLTRNNAKSLVRTVTQGIVNSARDEFAKANSDIIYRERFTSVLDGRTTVECLGLDGELYKIGEGPHPPLHRGCRSLRIPVVDGMDLVGERSTITDTRTARARNIDFRADAKASVGADKWKKLSVSQRNGLIRQQRISWQEKNIGRTPVKTSGADWLKSADKKFQDDYLGRKQAELFRSGELTLDKFVDASGKKLSVDSLYAQYADEFRRAGVSP